MSTPSDPPIRLLAAYNSAFPECAPIHILPVPGREMWVAAAFTDSGRFDVNLVDLGVQTAFTYQSAKVKQTILRRPLPAWARYPAGVIVRLANSGFDITGATLSIAGDEPPGPRYEYAVGLAVVTLYYAHYNLASTSDKLVEMVEQVRRQYVGC